MDQVVGRWLEAQLKMKEINKVISKRVGYLWEGGAQISKINIWFLFSFFISKLAKHVGSPHHICR